MVVAAFFLASGQSLQIPSVEIVDSLQYIDCHRAYTFIAYRVFILFITLSRGTASGHIQKIRLI